MGKRTFTDSFLLDGGKPTADTQDNDIRNSNDTGYFKPDGFRISFFIGLFTDIWRSKSSAAGIIRNNDDNGIPGILNGNSIFSIQPGYAPHSGWHG